MNEKFICKECNKEFSIPENLSKHVKYHNMNNKEYYDKHLKKQNEGICLKCGKSTQFNGIQRGYRKYCSKQCSNKGVGNTNSIISKIRKEKREEKYLFQCKECNEKFETSIKLNNHIIKNYGKISYYDKWIKKDNEGICKICGEKTEFTGRMSGPHSGYRDCCSKNCANKYCYDKRTGTNLEKYGVKNQFELRENIIKIQQTNLIRYGYKYASQSSATKEKGRITCLQNHGVDYPQQNKEIFEKSQKSAKTIKQFRDTEIWYQGSYELDFLEKYYDKYPDIQRGPSIKYVFKGKNKVYHPDFYIPSLNLVIEIKSSWTLKIDIEIKEKKKATIANGFKYLMILDKKYSKKSKKPIDPIQLQEL